MVMFLYELEHVGRFSNLRKGTFKYKYTHV